MASYPLPSPITIARPSPGQVYIDVRARPLEDVMAPEGGELVFVGDGTMEPFKGYSPGVVVMWGHRSQLLHVFGFIDRAWVDHLRSGGVWGWTGGLPGAHTSLLNRLSGGIIPTIPTPDILWDLNDALFGSPPPTPRPVITEGQKIGQVAPSRGYLRWMTITNAGAPQSPIVWAQQNALPAPQLEPLPIVSPPPPPVAQSADSGLGVLVGLYLLGSELDLF